MALFNRKDILIEVSLFFILAVFVLAFFFNETAVSFMGSYIGENYIVSVFLFIFIIFSATVIAPLTVMPLVTPIGVLFFGPLQTALFAIVGWEAGAIVAFLIARHVGRRILARFINLEKLDKYQRYIPERAEFTSLVLLRLLIPVDILSYAIGLFSRISLLKYSIATIIGITPFAFIISYGVNAIFIKDTQVIILSAIAGVILFAAVLIYYLRNIAKS